MAQENGKKDIMNINLKKWLLFNPKDWPDWFREGLEDFFYNSLGNLLPIWAMIIANFLNSEITFSFYDSIHQPFTYVILSGTYLTSSFYLQSKPKMGDKIIKFIYAPLLFIIGLLVAKKPILEDLSASREIELFVIVVFLICFLSYIIILFKSHYRRLKIRPTEIVKEEKDKLEKDFDKLFESQ